MKSTDEATVPTQATGPEVALEAPGGPTYEDCIVTFIDVLGFREVLKKPAPEVIRILETLRTFTKPDDEAPPERMKDVRAVSRAYAESVSDAVVRVRVFETDNRGGAFFQELLDLLHAQISCIRQGVLVRAGVAVGPAHVGMTGGGPIFGRAMVRAYEIESEEAVFPRIVVDEAAYQAFLNDERLRSEIHDSEEEREYVDRLLTIGEDGTRYIDYLRASETEFDQEIGHYEFLKRHAEIIEKGLTSTNNARVRRKYVWLERYHNQVIDERLACIDDAIAGAFEAEWEVDPRDLLRNARLLGS